MKGNDLKAKTKSERTEAKIILALQSLARTKGYASTTVRDICSEAGISIGAFYHHYASKEALVNQCFSLFDDTLDEELSRISTIPSIEAIKTILLKQTEFIVKEAGALITEYYKVILSQDSKPAVREDRRYYRAVETLVEKAMEQGLLSKKHTVRQTSELLIRFVRGEIIDWCLHNASYDIVKQTSEDLDLLLKALAL
jgi:AcrR family transcriptional regulator